MCLMIKLWKNAPFERWIVYLFEFIEWWTRHMVFYLTSHLFDFINQNINVFLIFTPISTENEAKLSKRQFNLTPDWICYTGHTRTKNVNNVRYLLTIFPTGWIE